jgi:hypothetical protein
MQVKDLTGAALDWAVAKCEGGLYQGPSVRDSFWVWPGDPVRYSKAAPAHSTDWALGGPLIEQEGINLSAHYKLHTGEWQAWCEHGPSAYGPTPLIAAMRCYVASKLGEEIVIPEELCE